MNIRSFLRILREVLVNIALPFAIYTLAQPRLGDVYALMAASAPPVLWSLLEIFRHRRFDALSLLVVTGIALSLFAFFGTGSMKMLQLRERIVTIVIAFLFLGSAAIGQPLMHEVIRAFLARTDDPQLGEMDAFRHTQGFRRAMTIMTVVWGLGLLADGLVSIALVYALPIKAYMVVSPILGYVTIGSLTLWNLFYGRQRRRANAAAIAAVTQRT